MTNFTNENLHFDGMYLFYVAGDERRFVARFKHKRDGWKSFKTFMIKHFTVEEYFEMLNTKDVHGYSMGPLTVLKSKGYIMPHIKTWMKRDGYPITPEGYKQWNDDYMAKIKAHYAVKQAAA